MPSAVCGLTRIIVDPARIGTVYRPGNMDLPGFHVVQCFLVNEVVIAIELPHFASSRLVRICGYESPSILDATTRLIPRSPNNRLPEVEQSDAVGVGHNESILSVADPKAQRIARIARFRCLA